VIGPIVPAATVVVNIVSATARSTAVGGRHLVEVRRH